MTTVCKKELKGTGKVLIEKFVKDETRLFIKNVFYVSSLQKNLFLVGTSKSYEVQFKRQSVIMFVNDKIIALDAKQDNDLSVVLSNSKIDSS